MWIYSQSKATMSHDGFTTMIGYAGNGQGLNNPNAQNIVGHGPLPQGFYIIGSPHDSPHTGLFTLDLTPDESNIMFGRSLFRIHGDNPEMNDSASDGCIILGRTMREAIASSGDNRLQVVE